MLTKCLNSFLLTVAVFAVVEEAQAQPPKLMSHQDVAMPTEPTDLIAVVDGLPILYRDVSQAVDNRIKAMIEKSGQQPSAGELDYATRQLVRMSLRKEIQTKLMYRAFIRKITGSEPAEKRAEMEKGITSNVRAAFYTQQIPQLLKQYGLETIEEADAELRKTGSSIEQQERMFIESVVAQQYVQGELDREPEIPLPDMKHFYKENQKKYERKARARWEQLTVLFEKFASKQEAYAAIVSMGNEAFFGGNVQAVAKRLSQEPLAEDSGGLHDWTFKGSLVSDQLDAQIFSLPLNKLSQIIEDDRGFHIVKVIDREPAGLVSFSEAQEEIRETLKEELVVKQQEKLLAALHKQIPVWSIFPDDVPEAKLLERTASASNSLNR